MPPTTDQQRVLDALVRHARPIVLSHFRADSCIASTRIGLDVLSYFGIPAKEYPLLVAVFNPEAVQLVESGVSLPDVRVATEAYAPGDRGGPWTMAVGATAPGEVHPDGWSGHLLIGSPALEVVVDLSIDQASRPHKDIVLTPYWAPVRSSWFTDPQAHETLLDQQTGVLLVLDRAGSTDPSGYLTSPNWQRKSGNEAGLYRRLTGQIISAVKADLGG